MFSGTICEVKKKNQSYLDVKPKPNAIKIINNLKKDGHEIVIYTSRHMKTCDNNVGKIVAKQGLNLLKWLNKNKIPYDEICFGKPLADIYIDDKAEKFINWNKINKLIPKMKANKK